MAKEIKDLYTAVMKLKTVEECQRFFEDLCTIKELQSMEQRFQVARLLKRGLVYTDILEKTGASSATISRVNHCIQYGDGGYSTVIDRMEDENSDE